MTANRYARRRFSQLVTATAVGVVATGGVAEAADDTRSGEIERPMAKCPQQLSGEDLREQLARENGGLFSDA